MVGMTPSRSGPDSGSWAATRDIDQVFAASGSSAPARRSRGRSRSARRNGASGRTSDAEPLLELLDRRAERRLADKAGLRRVTEMATIGERDQETELSKGRKNALPSTLIDFLDQAIVFFTFAIK